MNYLEFVQRMLTMANLVNVKIGDLNIKLDDVKITGTIIDATAIITSINIGVDDEHGLYNAIASDIKDTALLIKLQDIDGTVETALCQALLAAISDRLSDITMTVRGEIGKAAFTDVSIKLADQLAIISGEIGQAKFAALNISVEEVLLNADIQATEAPAVITALNITLNNGNNTIDTALYNALITSLYVYIDFVSLYNMILAEGITSGVVQSMQNEIAQITATAFKYALLEDYYDKTLEQMGTKTLDQLNKIYIGG